MDKKLKYNCIFGGGGIRGMCLIGAVKALKEFEIEIASVSGSSVGAVFAVLYAVGYSEEEITNLFLDFNIKMFIDINIGVFNNDIAFSKGEIFLEWLREKIAKKFYGKDYSKLKNKKVTFKDLDVDLNVLTLDIKSNTPFVFSKKTTPDEEVAFAVRASAGMPGLMKPIEYNNFLLVDGDLTKTWPGAKVFTDLDKPDTRILEFRLEGSKENENIKNPLDYANSIISTIWYLSTENVFNLYHNNDRYDYIVFDTKDVILFDFTVDKNVKKQLIDFGYETTKKYLSSSLIEKKKVIISKYKCILFRLNLLKNSLRQKNSKDSLFIVNDILSTMYEDLEYIDESFYFEIKNLKENIVKNIKRTLFFNKTIQQTDKLLGLNSLLYVKVEEKINELSQYVTKYS